MKERGFNLIELLIVMAIIGIITAVAYPSYNGYVERTRRVDAQAALATLANAMERNRSLVDTYVGVATGGAATGVPDDKVYTVPAGIAKYYTISITTADPTTYTLSAIPKGTQISDSCGTLTLSETGAVTPPACWGR